MAHCRKVIEPSHLWWWIFVLLFWSVDACAGASSEIVTVNVQHLSRTLGTNVSFTFGQVFKPGDIPAGVDLAAHRGSDGAPIPLQVDRKADHPDGSVRHAVLTARLPTLNDTETMVIARTPNQGKSGLPVQLSDLLNSSFAAEVSLDIRGERYTADARQLLEQAGTAQQWLTGPLVSEWIVGGPIMSESGNPHPQLAAYFHVRAYAGIQRVRVDVVVENDWTFVPHPAAFKYLTTIKIGNTTKYTRTITQYHHTRWHKVFWWGSDPQVYVEHDRAYLQATGAVPTYADLQPSQSYLSGMRQESVPMSHGDLTQYFPDTGAQDQIGPLPRWTATYVVSGDRRAFNSMLANDDAAASYSVHYRDEKTGGPVSIGNHPKLTTQFDDPHINGGIPMSRGSNPNTSDTAHQPSIGFVSYLLTGDYFYLEEMQFWASWNHLDANPLPPYGYRQGAKGIFGLQVRGQAWSLRTLAQAAYATPDNDPYKGLLVSSVQHNIAYNDGLYSHNPQANKLGALRSYDGFDQFAPWMDDFYTWTMGYLVDLGFDAVDMRNWKAKFPVARMGTTDYCYIKAAAYHLTVGPNNNRWWPDFGTLYRKNFGALNGCAPGEEMEGYPDSPAGFPSNLRPALAVAVDADIAGAEAAWQRFVTSAIQPDYANYPNWALAPRRHAIAGTGSDAGDTFENAQSWGAKLRRLLTR